MPIPSNKVEALFNALQTLLTSVTLPDASTPFDRIKLAADLDTNYLSKVPETQVLSQENREWDGENPELGTQELHLDLFTRDITQKAGEAQIVSDTGLNSLTEAVINQASNPIGGAFGAGCTLTLIEPPVREDVSNKVFLYRVRLTYNVVWG